MTVQQSILIDRPVAEVFAYLQNMDHRANYVPNLQSVELLTDGPLRLGSRFIETISVAGRTVPMTYEVVGFEENAWTQVETSDGPFPISADLRLRPDGQKTHLAVVLDATLKGIFRLGAPMVKKAVEQQAATMLKNIKHQLEE